VAIHRTFVTPFDRSPFLDLINALDDVIDLMKDPGRRMLRYGVAFTPEMQGMVDRAVRATMPWRDGMPLLGAIERNLDRLSAMSETVRQIAGEADELLDRGLRILCAGDTSPGHKLTVEKVYDLVDAVIDRCEDVGDGIDGIVVEQTAPVCVRSALIDHPAGIRSGQRSIIVLRAASCALRVASCPMADFPVCHAKSGDRPRREVPRTGTE